MCEISNYPHLYMKVEEELRHEGIKKEIPGFEFLRRAIVINKIEGMKDKKKFLEDVGKGVVIPSSEIDFKEKEKRKKRTITPIEQWMVEALRSADILEISWETFVKDISGRL